MALQRAFGWWMQQSGEFRSDPLALEPNDRPAFVVAVPMKDSNENFTGMLAAVVSLEPVLLRLQDASVRDRKVFVVDHAGHIVAHPDTKNFVPGTDLSGTSDLVKQICALPQELRSTQTIRFTQPVKNRSVEMICTFSTLPEINRPRLAQPDR